MADSTYLAFNCLNPECGKLIKFKRPAKTGVYAVTCPHCKFTKNLKLNGQDSVETPPAPAPAPKTAPDNSGKPEIELDEDFNVGNTYRVKCPHCNVQEFGFKAEKPGPRVVACPSCKGKCKFDVRERTVVYDSSDVFQECNGKLTLLRKGWLNKTYPLRPGRNTIGRHDEDLPSDISIKNDTSMSRRSVSIEVNHSDLGYSFKLTVLKATNAISHNGRPLTQGESISLNFGDVIVMGKTKFRFEKA